MSAAADLVRARLAYPVVAFGFWRTGQDEDSPLPWPAITERPDRDFLAMLEAVEAALTRRELNGGVMRLLGCSVSRLTGERLGNREFFLCDDAARVRYVWPEDFGSHYLAAGVAVPPAFRALITDLARRIPQSQENADASR